MDTFQQAPAKSKTGKVVGCVGCGCLGAVIAVLAIVGFTFFGIRKMATSSEAYQDSIAAIEANPAALEALGTPIEPGFLVQASYKIENGNESIDMSVPVSGPKGKGTLRVVGSKTGGAADWTYETQQLDLEGGTSIPLSR